MRLMVFDLKGKNFLVREAERVDLLTVEDFAKQQSDLGRCFIPPKGVEGVLEINKYAAITVTSMDGAMVRVEALTCNGFADFSDICLGYDEYIGSNYGRDES